MTIADKREFDRLTAKTEWLTAVITNGKASDKPMTESELNRAFEEYYRNEYSIKKRELRIKELTKAVTQEQVLRYILRPTKDRNRGIITLSRPCTVFAFLNTFLLEHGDHKDFCGKISLYKTSRYDERQVICDECSFAGYDIIKESSPDWRGGVIITSGEWEIQESAYYKFSFTVGEL